MIRHAARNEKKRYYKTIAREVLNEFLIVHSGTHFFGPHDSYRLITDIL
jgi:hypothetical protein